jgi:type VI secretion system protein ImpA
MKTASSLALVILMAQLTTPVYSANTGATVDAAAFVRQRGGTIGELREIADFSHHTEPHSPGSYFAEKAAKAGEQNLYT